MSGAVDVLAYLDALILSHKCLSDDAFHAQELPKAEAVRAAVAELQRKARLWDDLQTAKSKPLTPDDAVWQRLALSGKPIDAVKACRNLNGYGLREAKDVVESFVRSQQP